MCAAEYDCDVVIVGAGPVGLFAALWFAALGAQTEILDEAPGVEARDFSQPLCARALILLARAGNDELLDAGKRLSRLRVHEGSALKGELGLSSSTARHSQALTLEQSALESALGESLAQREVPIRW